MKKLIQMMLLAGTVALMASAVQAKEIQFQVDISSSGNSIYVCNAGIKHTEGAGRMCYWYGDPAQGACTPSADKNCTTGKCCVCTGTNGGAVAADYLKATYGDWVDNETAVVQSGSPVFKNTRDAGTSTDYLSLFNGDTAWGKMVTSLSIGLGSEKYGAQYFVDVCFRGSQINYAGTQAPHSIKASVTMNNLNNLNGLSYAASAGLTVQAKYVCDLQGGTKLPTSYSSSAFTVPSDLNANIDTFVGDAKGDSGAPKVFGNTALSDLINGWVNTGTTAANAPRFCKVRFEFAETYTAKMRKWLLEGAKACTFVAIEEDI